MERMRRSKIGMFCCREAVSMRAESGGAGQGRSVDRPLIASYSYSGHTHRAAQALQGLTGSDWCEIYPRQPYPMAFPELLAQVKRELKTGYRPKLLPLSHPPPALLGHFSGRPQLVRDTPAAGIRLAAPARPVRQADPALLLPLRRCPLRYAAGYPKTLPQGGGGGGPWNS